MISEQHLIKVTNDFFKQFWNSKNGQPPIWSGHWVFNNSIPNHDKRGCYVLFKGKEIIYIGVGIGEGSVIYKGCGLGSRLKQYFKLNKMSNSNRKYIPKNEWTEITSIMTIGFNENYYPLAAALEVYLISKLRPTRNSQHKNII